jgi:hypothetical protein
MASIHARVAGRTLVSFAALILLAFPQFPASAQTIKREDYSNYVEYAQAVARYNRSFTNPDNWGSHERTGSERSDTLSRVEAAKNSVVSIRSNLGVGSGVILSEDGVIATSMHVLDGVSEVVIESASGKDFHDFGVVDFDHETDLILIKVKAENLPRATLGDSERVRIGEEVFAIGAPRSYKQTVSKGIVSAIRTVGGESLLQVDAAMSPGSSGGGLFNLAGQLIGISSAGDASGESLNFATPINKLRVMLSHEVKYTSAEFRALSTASEEADTRATAGNQDISHLLAALISEYPDTTLIYRRGRHGLLLEERMFWYEIYDRLLHISSKVIDNVEFTEDNIEKIMRLSVRVDYGYLVYSEENEVLLHSELHLPTANEEGFVEVIAALLEGYEEVETELSSIEHSKSWKDNFFGRPK